jgi:hypothetical protein
MPKTAKLKSVRSPGPLVVKVTHHELRNQFSIPAIVKLKRSPNYPNMRAVKKMAEIGKALDKTFKASQDAFVGLVKGYAVLDDKGEIVENEQGEFQIPEEKKADWRQTLEKFMESETDLVLPYGKLSLDEVSKVGLTPEEYGAVPFLVE